MNKIPALIDQVTPLYLATKLRDLGVPQNSTFYWHQNPITDTWELLFQGKKDKTDIAAFTVTELGWLLPKMIKSSYLICYFKDEKWNTGYATFGIEEDELEVRSRAGLLVQLLEKNII